MAVALERRETAASGALSRPRLGGKRRSWLARVWSRSPEPRVRFGQGLLPGYALLGPGDAGSLAPLLKAAVDFSRGHATYEGLTVVLPDDAAWASPEAPAAWLAAHRRLHAMWPLVVASALSPTADARTRWYRSASELIRSWLGAVPEEGGAGADRTVLSRRLVGGLVFQDCFDPFLREDPELRGRLLRQLHQDAGTLSSAVGGMPQDAWLIATGRALLLAGRVFDGLEARQWQEQGADVVWTQLRAQVVEDGGHVSRSPSWQAFVLEDYAHVLALHDGELPDWARKRLKGMCDVLWRTTHGDGSLAQLGERAPRLWWPTSELVATVATLLGEPGLIPDGPLPGALPRLLLSGERRAVYDALPGRGARTESRAMRRTGLFVLGGADGDAMIVDGGAPRRQEQPFGFELALAGLPIAVSSWDAGAAGGRLGDYPASVRAQNVLIDGRPTAAGMAPPAVGPEAHWMLRDGLVSFVGAWGRQRRLVLCRPGRFWLVLDEMRGVGPWTGESLVHLHPETQVRVRANGRTVVDVARSRLAQARIAFAGSCEIRMIGGLLGPRPQGWLARGDGAPEPAPTLAVAVEGTLPLCTGYAIVPRSDQEVVLDVTHEPMRIGATLRVGRHRYDVDVLQDEIEVRTEIL